MKIRKKGKIMKKSLLLSKILLGSSFLFVGCGGGGSESSGGGGNSNSVSYSESTSLSQVTGVVSDGPIKNARVFLDLNNDSIYTDGEPYDITDTEGKYAIKYVLDPATEYVVISEGNTTLGTEDTTTDNTGLLNFKMFNSVKTVGSINENISGSTYTKDLTPITFKSYLTELVTKVNSNTTLTTEEKNSVKDNLFIKSIVEDTSNNKQSIFQKILINESGTNNTSFIVGNAIDSLNGIIKNSLPTLSGFTIDNENGLEDLLTNGNLNQETVGIKSLINTKIAYQIANDYEEDVTKVDTNVNGIKKTITYEKNGNNITAVFKQIVTLNSEGLETSEYEGAVIFDTNKNVLSARYTQKHAITSNLNKRNRVDGAVSITKTNSGTKLDFTKAEFDIHTLEYGNIAGKVEVLGALTQKHENLINDNTIDLSQIKIVTASEPVKLPALYPSSLVGNWNGTLSSSCAPTTGEISLSFLNEYKASWQGSFGSNIYGTTLSVSGTTLTLKNDSTTFGTATIGQTNISGSWNDGTCSGTYSVSKEIN